MTARLSRPARRPRDQHHRVWRKSVAGAALAASVVLVATLALAPAASAAGWSCTGSSFQAEAVQNGSTWTSKRGSQQVYQGNDMLTAINAAIGSLDGGRNYKQRVVVNGSGSMSANSRITMPSYTALEVCGTIHVTGTGSGNVAGIYARGATDVEVSRLSMTGTPVYGIFMRNVDNVMLGQIDMRFSGGGIGIRVDNHGDRSRRSHNLTINDAYVAGMGSHGIETYGVDGIRIGTVTARNTGHSGLLLNDSVNATIGTVDAQGAGTGTGYAAFRMANKNGNINGSYWTNIRVGTVRAHGGGRGVFCVSESGGVEIDRIEIANTGSNAVLIENCYNVSLATSGGMVSNGEIRLAARTEFAPNRDITLRNIWLSNGASVRESPCTTNLWIHNVNGGRITRC